MHRLEIAIFVLCFILFSLCSSVFETVYNVQMYDREFAKHEVYTFFDKETAMKGISEMLLFLKEGKPLSDFFNDNEKNHLADVKAILDFLNRLYLFSILGLAVFLIRRKHITKVLTFSGMITIGLIMILSATYFLAGFDTPFVKFHVLFFSGNYAFDPAVSNMKALLPDGLFQDMAIDIVQVILLKAAAFLFLGHMLEKNMGKIKQFRKWILN